MAFFKCIYSTCFLVIASIRSILVWTPLLCFLPRILFVKPAFFICALIKPWSFSDFSFENFTDE
ncbi:unnamed protein product [Meloidogyne enterolobii]|uniref:Uncharacterized protein n=1 Tax=Meloidogyne enterolobii TaxID=390850 RepID=A0ACB1AGN9_MELEN